MRVLITGASGFVGGHLIRHLREADPNAEIVGTVHVGYPIPPAPDSQVRVVPCDITAHAGLDVRALVADAQPNHLYHLAGAASGAADDREMVFAANVTGTQCVMAAIREEAPLCRSLFVSTGYVYGPCDPNHPAREDAAPHPSGIYAESKQAGEPSARAAGAIVARAFNHTGPGQTEAFAVPAFARQIARVERGLQPPQIEVGNLDARRDFLDVRDVVRAYRLLLEHGILGETYNVCSGKSWAMRDILSSLLDLSPTSIEIVSNPGRMRPSDLPVSVGDSAKLEALTGWGAQIPFEQTLRDTLDWWREQS
ncbi:MAG: GDP-mannose 4,6-dehydratase [Armatimonadota bacterium]|nr:GDP-mannose 4,6-dehydratase [Armatimonadota bacterium]